MASRTLGLFLVVSSGVLVVTSACAPDTEPTTGGAAASEARIRRVEQGLSPPVQVEDGPVWNLEERMERYRVPGVGIAVIEDFEVVWAKGYGVREAGTGEPVDTETLFQAASISKPVAAAAALRLVQNGVLDLDEDVNRRLVSWKVPENEFTRDEKVTLRRLLSHSAGLTVHGFRGYAAGEAVPDIVQVLDGLPPANSDPIRVDQVPGTGYRYSGGGYTVLQLLIEDTTGRPLPDLVQEMVFEPAGMHHSSFEKPLPPELEPLTTSGHDRDGTPHPGHQFLSGGSTCCGLWTTPSDLARFAITIANAAAGADNGVLNQDLARSMIAPLVDDQRGLGFAVETRDATRYFSHGGGNPGFSCYLIMQPDEGYGAAVMTNGDNGGLLNGEILRSIAREYGWQSYLPARYASFADLLSERRRLREEEPDHPGVTEAGMNRLGYQLLGSDQLEWAIAVFELNVEFYPESSNVYDSLGDGQAAAGDTQGALSSYRQALAVLERVPEKSPREHELIAMEKEKIERLQAAAPEPGR